MSLYTKVKYKVREDFYSPPTVECRCDYNPWECPELYFEMKEVERAIKNKKGFKGGKK